MPRLRQQAKDFLKQAMALVTFGHDHRLPIQGQVFELFGYRDLGQKRLSRSAAL